MLWWCTFHKTNEKGNHIPIIELPDQKHFSRQIWVENYDLESFDLNPTYFPVHSIQIQRRAAEV